MNVKELKKLIEAVPDNAKVVISFDYIDENGEECSDSEANVKCISKELEATWETPVRKFYVFTISNKKAEVRFDD